MSKGVYLYNNAIRYIWGSAEPLTDPLVAKGGELVVRELVGTHGELGLYTVVGVGLKAGSELSERSVLDKRRLLLLPKGVSSEESFHSFQKFTLDVIFINIIEL